MLTATPYTNPEGLADALLALQDAPHRLEATPDSQLVILNVDDTGTLWCVTRLKNTGLIPGRCTVIVHTDTDGLEGHATLLNLHGLVISTFVVHGNDA